MLDIVFADSSSVQGQWKILLEKSRPDVAAQEYDLKQCKLLELMANYLGYKDKISWENIQKPYYPQVIRPADSDEYPNHEWTSRVGQRGGKFFRSKWLCQKKKQEGTNQSNT